MPEGWFPISWCHAKIVVYFLPIPLPLLDGSDLEIDPSLSQTKPIHKKKKTCPFLSLKRDETLMKNCSTDHFLCLSLLLLLRLIQFASGRFYSDNIGRSLDKSSSWKTVMMGLTACSWSFRFGRCSSRCCRRSFKRLFGVRHFEDGYNWRRFVQIRTSLKRFTCVIHLSRKQKRK